MGSYEMTVADSGNETVVFHAVCSCGERLWSRPLHGYMHELHCRTCQKLMMMTLHVIERKVVSADGHEIGAAKVS